MKRIVPLLALFLFSCGGNPPENEAKAVVKTGSLGQTAPDFSLTSLDGKLRHLSNFKGKVVLLDFWATWCPPCRMSIPALVRLNKKMAGKNFEILGVSMDDDPDTVKPFIKKQNIEYLVFMSDENIRTEYRIRSIPTFVLIDPQGSIVKTYQGFHPEMEKEWEKQINHLLGTTQAPSLQ